MPTSTAKAKFRILYLGSDGEFIRRVREKLPDADYHLVRCADTEGATLFLKSEIPYRLLLVDLDWRGEEGLTFAQLARNQPHRKRMPIVLLINKRLAKELEVQAAKAGVTEYVKKSDIPALVEVVHRIAAK